MSSRVLDALKPPLTQTDIGDRHTLVVTADQSIEVRDSEGQVQVCIRLDGDVPTVQLSGARLEVESTESVTVKTKLFAVQAAERVELQSEGSVEISSKKGTTVLSDEDFVVKSPCIWLN